MKHSFSCLGIFAGIISCSLLFSTCSYAQDSSNNEEELLPQETSAELDAAEGYQNSEEIQKFLDYRKQAFGSNGWKPDYQQSNNWEEAQQWAQNPLYELREKWNRIDIKKLTDEYYLNYVKQREKSIPPKSCVYFPFLLNYKILSIQIY